MSTAEDLTGGELREGYAEIGDQRLHYMEAGEGPLIVLLHGFPEFWYGWRLQIQPLTASRPTTSACWPPISGTSSTNAVNSPRCWSAMTGAEASPGPPR